jgi:hypothetical protein
MLGETFLPGSGLWRLGRHEDAVASGSISIPLLAVGQGLIVYYYLFTQGGVGAALESGYPFSARESDPSFDWMLGLGEILFLSGRAVGAWSALETHEEYYARMKGYARGAGEGPLDLIAAPFSPATLSPFVLPVAALIGAATLPADAATRFEAFFGSPTQSFWGITASPAGALALAATAYAARGLASALAGEILFRGLFLRRDGLGVSLIASGADSLLGLVVPGRPLSKTLIAAGTGMALGAYGAALSASDGGRLRRPVALRFWLEWSQSLLGYMMEPERSGAAIMGMKIEY